MPLYNAIISASIGNVLAIVVNYFLGYILYEKSRLKLKSSQIGKSALAFGLKYKYPSLFLSWLPVIGDPLTIVAGLLRVRFIVFLSIAGFFRVFRYYLLSTF